MKVIRIHAVACIFFDIVFAYRMSGHHQGQHPRGCCPFLGEGIYYLISGFLGYQELDREELAPLDYCLCQLTPFEIFAVPTIGRGPYPSHIFCFPCPCCLIEYGMSWSAN
jgi:hypothetical protein